MLCQKCQRHLPDEFSFCGFCGSPLQGRKTTLKDLLDAGILKAGDQITCGYRGKDFEATITAEGKINHNGKDFPGPLVAAEAIRGMVCDSWFCWKYFDPSVNRSRPIAHYRAELEHRGGSPPH